MTPEYFCEILTKKFKGELLFCNYFGKNEYYIVTHFEYTQDSFNPYCMHGFSITGNHNGSPENNGSSIIDIFSLTDLQNLDFEKNFTCNIHVEYRFIK